MNPITFQKLIQPPQLDGELLAAFPTLKTTRSDGLADVHYQLEALSGANRWRMSFDDTINLDPAAVQAVITAHVPQPWPVDVQRAADAADLKDYRDTWLQMATALGWDAAAKTWGANTGQWDALTAAQRTTFQRRLLSAIRALATYT